MSDFKKHVVTTFQEYINVLKEIRRLEGVDRSLWYRGQFNANHQLIPSAFRGSYALHNQFGFYVHPSDMPGRGEAVAIYPFQRALVEFKEIAKPYVGSLIWREPENDLQWYFLAQHYSVPTTLLDWSNDPLIGLFFAVNGNVPSQYKHSKVATKEFLEYSYSPDGAAIFVMDPEEMNDTINSTFKDTHTGKQLKKVLDIAHSRFNGYFERYISEDDDERPFSALCVLGSEIDRRICRQSGNFLIYGNNVKPIDDIDIARSKMHKIFIPYDKLPAIRDTLNLLNITSKSVYGDSTLDEAASVKVKDLRLKFQEGLTKALESFHLDLNIAHKNVYESHTAGDQGID